MVHHYHGLILIYFPALMWARYAYIARLAFNELLFIDSTPLSAYL